MEIKVQCDCGQKFKFDVEPENGRMPWEVTCPVCGLSGTDKANWIIAHAAPPAPESFAPIGSATSAPVAVPVTSAEPPKARLVISRPQAAAVSAAPTPVPRPAPRQVGASVMKNEPPSTNTLFFRGVLGAFVGAMVGMGVWYGLTVATGYQIGIVAWGVGALTGFGARVLAREGNTALGVVSAFFAMMAILLGGTLAVHHMIASELGGMSMENLSHEIYMESVKEAKEAGSLDTDAQIKAFLVKRDGGDESEIAQEDIDAFKQDELPEMKELASGSLTEQEYSARYHHEAAAAGGVASAIGWVAAFIGSIFSLWTILWLILGCASAYKIGADASG
jgi:hypothetical protein